MANPSAERRLILRVETFKSGPFVFTAEYDRESVNQLILKADVLWETVKDLPILPKLASQLREDLIRRSIFGTAAIEGNPLSEEIVGQVISRPNGSTATERAQREIQNLKRAYNLLDPNPIKPLVIQEEQIRRLHYMITEGIKHEHNVPGVYRNHIVKVGDSDHGGTYTPPKIIEDILNLMGHFCTWMNQQEILQLPAFVRAAIAHYHLAVIHPFSDGNGRVARLIEAMILRASGIDYVPVMLSNFYYRNLDDYFWAFSRAEKNQDHQITDFLAFILSAVVWSLTEIKGNIIHFIRQFTLRDYYQFLSSEGKLKRRQHDLMSILLDKPTPFSLADLFTDPRFQVLYRNVHERTARRDLKQLCDMALLECKKDQYNLNYRVVGLI
ncbi:MAG TPA: Fic family protein [Nitrospirota bacterium]|nr:Fic family protein [Nitrospirota bacterium]